MRQFLAKMRLHLDSVLIGIFGLFSVPVSIDIFRRSQVAYPDSAANLGYLTIGIVGVVGFLLILIGLAKSALVLDKIGRLASWIAFWISVFAVIPTF